MPQVPPVDSSSGSTAPPPHCVLKFEDGRYVAVTFVGVGNKAVGALSPEELQRVSRIAAQQILSQKGGLPKESFFLPFPRNDQIPVAEHDVAVERVPEGAKWNWSADEKIKNLMQRLMGYGETKEQITKEIETYYQKALKAEGVTEEQIPPFLRTYLEERADQYQRASLRNKVWNLFSLIIFPVGVYRLIRWAVTPAILRNLLPAQMPQSSKEDLQSLVTAARERCSPYGFSIEERAIALPREKGVSLSTFQLINPLQKDKPAAEQQWVLYFGDCSAESNLESARELSERTGANVYIGNYRGLGKSQGELHSMADLQEDALLMMDDLLQITGVGAPSDNIFLFGESFGSVVVAEAAKAEKSKKRQWNVGISSSFRTTSDYLKKERGFGSAAAKVCGWAADHFVLQSNFISSFNRSIEGKKWRVLGGKAQRFTHLDEGPEAPGAQLAQAVREFASIKGKLAEHLYEFEHASWTPVDEKLWKDLFKVATEDPLSDSFNLTSERYEEFRKEHERDWVGTNDVNPRIGSLTMLDGVHMTVPQGETNRFWALDRYEKAVLANIEDEKARKRFLMLSFQQGQALLLITATVKAEEMHSMPRAMTDRETLCYLFDTKNQVIRVANEFYAVSSDDLILAHGTIRVLGQYDLKKGTKEYFYKYEKFLKPILLVG